MSDTLIADIEAPDAVMAELRRGEHVRRAMAGVRQERINAACRQIKSRLMDGIGQLTHRIDADVYWAARAKFGDKCWSDKGFVKDCEKRGMIQRVEGKSDKIISLGTNTGPARVRRFG
jgi:hypothetical protein